MPLYLVQHGEAAPEAEDPARPLTARGRAEVERVAAQAARLGLALAEIRHSDKLRARQTAEILARHLRPARGLRQVGGLAPHDDPRPVAAELAVLEAPVLVVGHLPHLARLAALLLGGDPARPPIRFRSGALVCLDRTEAGWACEWILTPELAAPPG